MGTRVAVQITGREYRLRSHLIVFGLAAFLPMTILAGFLLFRSAASERADLEARLLHVAENLSADLDRELSNLITTLKTLATSPALQAGDLAAFHAQAKAAVAGLGGAIFLVEPEILAAGAEYRCAMGYAAAQNWRCEDGPARARHAAAAGLGLPRWRSQSETVL